MDRYDRYFQFHGKSARRERQADFHVPRDLIVLGKAVAIEYECDKVHGGGDGKKAVYRHVFETPAVVCMDETGKRQIYIVGNKVRITEAGIEK